MNRSVIHIFCPFYIHEYDKQGHHIEPNQLASICQTPKYLSYEAYIRCVYTEQLWIDVVTSDQCRYKKRDFFYSNSLKLNAEWERRSMCSWPSFWYFFWEAKQIYVKIQKWKKTCSITYVFFLLLLLLSVQMRIAVGRFYDFIIITIMSCTWLAT